MKKLYLLLLALISFSAQAQTTKVFPDSVAYWRSMNLYIDDNTYNISIADYIMLGDTLVDNKIYKNLFLHRSSGYKYERFFGAGTNYSEYYDDRYGVSNKIGLLRKDSLKIFFRYHKGKYYPKIWGLGKDTSLVNEQKEYILADFELNFGDTLFSLFYSPNSAKYMLVSEKGLRVINGDTLEIIKFNGLSNKKVFDRFTDSSSLIFGMGFNPSLFFRLYDFDTSGIVVSFGSLSPPQTIDFCSDGKIIYHSPQFYATVSKFDCSVIDMEVSVGITEHNKTSLTAYPNPAKDYITLTGFEGEDVMSIHISDILGHKQELKYEVDGEQALVDISSLPQGLYLVTVYTDKTTYLCRIIKQ